MSKKIGMFVDSSNFYYACAQKYFKRKLDYKAYYEYVKELGSIESCFVYGVQVGTEAKKFIERVVAMGYTPKYRAPMSMDGDMRYRGNWKIGITVDIMTQFQDLDIVVIGSSEYGYDDLIRFLTANGKQVIIMAFGIPYTFKEIDNCVCIEIPESMLEKRPVREKQPVVEGQPDAKSFNEKATTDTPTIT